MTSDQFAYWLQGFAELNGSPPSAEQWQIICDHLALVFNKVTPNRSPSIGAPYLPGQPGMSIPLMRSECITATSTC